MTSRSTNTCKVVLLALVMVAGCAQHQPTTRPYDAAMTDPMNYEPKFDRDISGGSLWEYDKDGMRKDLDSVFNP